jgi:hypothetical protein
MLLLMIFFLMCFAQQHKDGHIFPILLNVSDVCYDGSKFYVGSIRKAPDTSTVLSVSKVT